MPVSAKPRTTKPRAKKAAAPPPENLTPSETIGLEIVTAHKDLAPSVNRILESDLGEAGRLEAITLFRASLDAVGDPNRNPAIAIEAGRAADEAPPAEPATADEPATEDAQVEAAAAPADVEQS